MKPFITTTQGNFFDREMVAYFIKAPVKDTTHQMGINGQVIYFDESEAQEVIAGLRGFTGEPGQWKDE